MNHPSIAICVSGQIRTSVKELARISKEAEAINADLFVSVWSARGGKTFEGAVGPKNIRRIIGAKSAQILPDHWLGRMREIFPNSNDFFPKPRPVTDTELAKVFPNAVIEVEADGPQFNLNAGDSNSLRMVYKIWRSNQLKRENELRRGVKYEKVVRVRPDMLFHGATVQNLKMIETSLFVQGHAGHRENYINDTIWVSSSENDDKICEIYNRCLAAKDNGWKGIHQELFDVVAAAGLVPQVANVVKTGIGNFGLEGAEPSEYVRDNLFDAIINGELNPDHAGGKEFCELVGEILQTGRRWAESGTPPKIFSSAFDTLEQIKNTNRNAYFHALIYLANICLLNPDIPATDRTELMFRIVGYYCYRNAAVFLDVKIGDMPTLFENSPDSLHNAIIFNQDNPQPLISETARQICERWDIFWQQNIRTDMTDIRRQVSKSSLAMPKFVIDLHGALSRKGHHDKAFGLAEKWVEAKPDFWRGYDLLASSALALGLSDSASSIYAAAEENAPPHTRIKELKGRLLAKTGKKPEALAAFKESLLLPGCNKTRVSGLIKSLDNSAITP